MVSGSRLAATISPLVIKRKGLTMVLVMPSPVMQDARVAMKWGCVVRVLKLPDRAAVSGTLMPMNPFSGM